jgi:hypothetical protein
MAILKDDNDEYEVRISRHPGNAQFDEYIKIGDREKPKDTECVHYIVGEAGVTYTIEVILKKGFRFGNYSRVRAKLHLLGQKDSVSQVDIFNPNPTENEPTIADISRKIEYANVVVDGQKMLETRFTFRNLVAG